MKSATTISPATLRLAALILAIATVIASPPAGGTNQAESISLELEVWPLQGRTAHYRIAIDESGRCVYVGVSGTKVAGPSSRLLRPDQLARIASGLRRLGYWELAGEQRLGSSDPLRGFDQLHMVLRVRGGGFRKKCSSEAPEAGGCKCFYTTSSRRKCSPRNGAVPTNLRAGMRASSNGCCSRKCGRRT